MSYNLTAANGKNEYTNLDNAQRKIGNLAFDLIWKGSSSTALTRTLTMVVNNIEQEKAKLSGFFSALDLLEVYKQNKEKINQLKARLFLIPDTEKNSSERSSLQGEISKLEQENANLRSQIEGILSQITPIGTKTTLISHDVDFNYLTDIDSLASAYKLNLSAEERSAGARPLVQLKGGTTLSDFYNKVDENGNVIQNSGYEYIKSVMSAVENTYSGREAAVNSALAMLKLASDKGVKLDYKHQGTNSNPYVSTAYVVNGVDCNPWTSWVVDKGTPNGFQWRPVGGFNYVGETLNDWTKAQPGDVFVNEGHVGVIIENDPSNQQFVIAHASGTEIGIVLQTKTYSGLASGGYQIRDMTKVYDGTQNTDRNEAFNI